MANGCSCSYPRFPHRDRNEKPQDPPDSLQIDAGANSLDELPDTCDDLDSVGKCNEVDNEPLFIDAMEPIPVMEEPADSTYPNVPPFQLHDYSNDPYVMPADPRLFCFKGEGIDYLEQPSAPHQFVQENIPAFCDMIEGTPMSAAKQNSLTLMYPLPSPGFDVLLSAGWQVGDETCTETRAPSLDECITQLSQVLNNCDTDSRQRKYGGTRVNSCISWTIVVQGTGATPLL